MGIAAERARRTREFTKRRVTGRNIPGTEGVTYHRTEEGSPKHVRNELESLRTSMESILSGIADEIPRYEQIGEPSYARLDQRFTDAWSLVVALRKKQDCKKSYLELRGTYIELRREFIDLGAKVQSYAHKSRQ